MKSSAKGATGQEQKRCVTTEEDSGILQYYTSEDELPMVNPYRFLVFDIPGSGIKKRGEKRKVVVHTL
jgi:hypothetical protein